LVQSFLDEFEPFGDLANHFAHYPAQFIVGMFQKLGQRATQVSDSLRNDNAIFGQQAACLIDQSRANFHQLLPYSMDRLHILLRRAVLTATNRIDGRLAASQIASASLASFLLAFTYGFTKFGPIWRISWPSFPISRAQ
jgi:hypothetical protein